MRLDELLLNLDGLSDEEAEELGRREYRELYLNRGKFGVLELYKGGEVVFHEDRYEHAFRSSPNRIRNPYSKAKVARDRIERIRWIRAIIQGEVPKTECWAVAPQSRRPGRDRLYVVLANRFVVWLFPRKDGGWKFSSAYSTTAQDIQRYTRGGTQVWTVPEKEEAP
jgi:hypothetical protein